MPRGKTLPKWPIKPGDPDWPTCKCGCGTPVGAWHRGSVKDGVLMGQPHEYARGHSGRMHPRNGDTKWCPTCEAFKSIKDFGNHGPGKALNHECRACSSLWMKQYLTTYTPPDPEKAAADNRRKASEWRARRRGAWVEYVDPRVVLERDKGVCGICHLPVDPERFEVDHIVPLSRGGEHSYANVRVSHVACNRRKKDRLDSEM